MKKLLVSLGFLLATTTAYADITLPNPQTSEGIGVFDALKKRSSTPGGGFTAGSISDEQLSTILWSASGLNRGKTGWTVPMATGKAPYVKLYVAGANGAFKYNWDGHYLQNINDSDIRGDIGLQNFVKRATYSIIFVADGEALSAYDAEKANNFSQIAVGAMSQNIYLACASLKLKCRYIHSIKPNIISEELKLDSNDKPIGIMLIGK
ncbi:nitroreductase family protein [Orbaceae bacterium ac157xtp]